MQLPSKHIHAMRYLHTMVRIKDLEKSLNFYCDILGLIEVSRRDSEEGRYTNIFLTAQEDTQQAHEVQAPLLELTYNWPNQDDDTEEYSKGQNFGHLAYEVDDIYQTCQDLLDKGIIINRPPRDGRMAFINSPDGISIELLQKGDALPPKEPWVSMENIGSW